MNVENIEIEKINFDKEKWEKRVEMVSNKRTKRYKVFNGMKYSIKEVGLLQPIGIKQDGERYKLLFGYWRLIAAKELGWKEIPATIFDANILKEANITLTENSNRMGSIITEDLALIAKIDSMMIQVEDVRGDIEEARRFYNKAKQSPPIISGGV